MGVDEIRRLVKLVEESEIEELEVRRWWKAIRITKRLGNHREEGTTVVPVSPVTPAPAPAPPPAAAEPPPAALGDTRVPTGQGGTEAEGLVQIRSPMVGTFYRAPNPDAPAYVDVGSRVEKGQVVCIVEAMKLMNEIESEVAGTITAVSLENGEPVEFNQTLFNVRPD